MLVVLVCIGAYIGLYVSLYRSVLERIGIILVNVLASVLAHMENTVYIGPEYARNHRNACQYILVCIGLYCNTCQYVSSVLPCIVFCIVVCIESVLARIDVEYIQNMNPIHANTSDLY